jgi:hypothetical protein
VHRFLRHHHFPDQVSGDAVQRDQMSVVGCHKHLVAQDCHTAIRTERRISQQSRRASTRIQPDLVTGAGIERVGLLRTGGVHNSVNHQGGCLQSQILQILPEIGCVGVQLLPERNGINPPELSLLHIPGIDTG